MSKKDVIVKMYYDHKTDDIMKAAGCPRSYVSFVAREEHLKRREDIVQYEIERAKIKRTEAVRAQNKMERFRIQSGIKQETKKSFLKIPFKMAKSRWLLKYKWNYIYDEEDPKIFYYDEETRRTPREYHYVAKWGFRFIKAE